MSLQNPFHQVHDALWNLLESNSDFTAAVPSMNRIKYTGTLDPRPDKDNAEYADYPMVRIRSLGFDVKAFDTSNSSRALAYWSIDVYSGDQRFAMPDKKKFFDVQWGIYQALLDWKNYIYDFTWDGTAFKVRTCRALKAEDQFQHDPYSTLGWTSVWRGVTDIWFTTDTLQP